MSTNQLIVRNLKKNIKNYSLYAFALIFTVALYFAFVTLQYDPAMDAAKGSIKGGAAIKSASILLVAIVGVFLLYANTIFIKRRSKEIGLFQLIGMTKQEIFRILSFENIILYFSSLIVGIFVGFSFSKLITLILFKVTAVESVATLRFSTQAFIQTVIVFSAIYLVIMTMNFLFIRKQSILSLFRVKSSSEEKVKKISVVEILIGVLGLTLIISGYYVSSKLFGGDFSSMTALFLAMVFILGSVIIGTYLFYKGSVRFIANVIRKKKQGYLNIHEVLSLSSIMFRMKSNAMLLTIITTVSALAIGLLSLSYISYYSADQQAINSVPDDFSFTIEEDAEQFKQKLTEENIEYEETVIPVLQANVNVKNIMNTKLEGLNTDPNSMQMPVVSDKQIDGIDVSPDETIFTGYNDLLQNFMGLKDSGEIAFVGSKEVIDQQYLGLEKNYPISWYFTSGGLPTAIVDESTFQLLEKDLVQDIQKESNLYIGISLINEDDVQTANDIFKDLGFNESSVHDSQLNMSNNQKNSMGLVMFIVGFLGLTFLITSGCILYFKQMDESEDEKPNYTILRKLGFTQTDLLKGIQVKQVYNFGIPLIIGLLHSYFAVQSGWFLFGTEVWTPMLIVMGLYTLLYSIFAVLSIMYDKNVIKSAL
ncbi:FtsX-like permease family protein [Metabacillus halosaccharovorans]|uniref:FtsX-like permease family protein n=1 Tax=Metabacillus halosaccharovorans TaxID=930124 RepID=UPI001C1FECF5|nr:ABC transporter permease [Metabacillus halosaccharovorans]MBU7594208.1 FtsX-like permease family protein [Metabacillus halosaccharovorans]